MLEVVFCDSARRTTWRGWSHKIRPAKNRYLTMFYLMKVCSALHSDFTAIVHSFYTWSMCLCALTKNSVAIIAW